MSDKHNYSFFGQEVGVILTSNSMAEPHIFLQCVRKKDDDSWEKIKQGEAKTIKLSLEEMVMIEQVLKKETAKWSTVHKHKDVSTQIIFNWITIKGNEAFGIKIGDYFKPLIDRQYIVFQKLLDHIINEKIEHSTTFQEEKYQKKVKEILSVNTNTPKIQPEAIIIDSNKGNSGKKNNDAIKIGGIVNGETEKALLILFDDGQEVWIPKSQIRSNYLKEQKKYQNFLIEDWILKKKKITK